MLYRNALTYTESEADFSDKFSYKHQHNTNIISLFHCLHFVMNGLIQDLTVVIVSILVCMSL